MKRPVRSAKGVSASIWDEETMSAVASPDIERRMEIDIVCRTPKRGHVSSRKLDEEEEEICKGHLRGK